MFFKQIIYFRYNRIRNESAPVEFQLVEDEVENIDNLINYGQEHYDWNSEGIELIISPQLYISFKLNYTCSLTISYTYKFRNNNY